MKRIANYARKSVFSDKSDSTQAQYNMCLEYCQSHYTGFDMYRYEDEGYTGANVDRPAYSRLITDIEDGKLDIVICYKIDRISRNVSDFSNFFNVLTEHNVEFVSIKEQIDTSTPLGRAMMYICSVFAQMERETIAERVKDGMLELAKSGKWAGGRAPLGYMRERIQIGDKTHTMLVEDSDGILFLNSLSDGFLEGNCSVNSFALRLKKEGVTAIKGGHLSGPQIHNILRNPVYCCADSAAYDYFEELGCIMAVERDKFDGIHGIMSYGRTQGGKKKKHTINSPDKWIISVGMHKPLWSSEKYIKIQSRFGHNKINKKRKHEIGLLKGVLRCSCGWLMGMQHKVDKTYKSVHNYYFCQQRNRKGVEYCNRQFTNIEYLDTTVLDILKQIKLNKTLIDDYVYKPDITIVCRSRTEIQNDIKKAEDKIANLTKTLSTNTNSTAAKYIISEIETIDQQLSGLKYELLEVKSTERKRTQLEQDKETKYNIICQIVDTLDTASYTEINNLIKELFKECIYDGERLHIKI